MAILGGQDQSRAYHPAQEMFQTAVLVYYHGCSEDLCTNLYIRVHNMCTLGPSIIVCGAFILQIGAIAKKRLGVQTGANNYNFMDTVIYNKQEVGKNSV